MSQHDHLRIAASSDLHYSSSTQGKCRYLFTHASRHADVLLLCGDLTSHGGVLEALALAHDLDAFCQIPVIAVLGNHDADAGHETEVKSIFSRAGVKILDGDTTTIGQVGFAGVCGYGGGFSRTVRPQIHDGVDQAAQLERALLSLETKYRVALTHYAPIRETLRGEPPAIHASLGSSRLECALNAGHATVAFHGHAHNGSYAGHTSEGIGVFNVALPVLHSAFPERPPYVVFQPKKAGRPLVAA